MVQSLFAQMCFPFMISPLIKKPFLSLHSLASVGPHLVVSQLEDVLYPESVRVLNRISRFRFASRQSRVHGHGAFLPKYQAVRAKAGQFVYTAAINHHHCRQEIVPVVAMFPREHDQHHEQSMVKSLDQTITSWMIQSHTRLVCPQQETQLLHEVIFKFAALILMDHGRYNEETDDQLDKCVCVSIPISFFHSNRHVQNINNYSVPLVTD